MPHSYASLHAHIVFVVKDRTPVLTDAIAERLYPYLGGIASAYKSPLIAIGGVPDHLHLLVSKARETAVAELMRDLKASSSNGSISRFRTFDNSPGRAAMARFP